MTFLERMLLIRRFEEAVVLLAKDHSFGHFHLYIGQEATSVGIMEAIREGDLVATNHRNHGHLIGRGADPARALAEILGRGDGLNHGYGGTLHLTDKSTGFLPTSAIVGGSIGYATGAGFALKRMGKGGFSVAFFGDGTFEEGLTYECMNLASIWSLPVLFICENNSQGAPGAKAGLYPASQLATVHLERIPSSLGIPTKVVDGRDPEAIYAAVMDFSERLRQGNGPAYLETKTERWPGSNPHWPELLTGLTNIEMAWDEALIAGEYTEWFTEHDPVLRYARKLIKDGEINQDGIREIDRRVNQRVSDASNFAVASPFPQPESATIGTFA